MLVAAELIAADRGLGFMIMNERNTGGSVSVIIVGILLIGALNLITDAVIGGAIQKWIGKKFVPWLNLCCFSEEDRSKVCSVHNLILDA